MRVAGVRIRGAEFPDDRSYGLVLFNRVAADIHRGGRFVQVIDRDGDDLLEEGALRVGRSDADAVAVLRFEIDIAVGPQFVALDREGGVVRVALARHQGVGVRVGGIGVRRGEDTDDRAAFNILVDGRVAQLEVGRFRVVALSGDCDRQHLLDAQTVRVRTADANGVGVLHRMIEDFGGLDLVAIERKRIVVVIAFAGDQRIRMCIVCVRIVRRQLTHDRADRLAGDHRAAAQVDGGRSLIDVRHVDYKDLLE